MKAGDQEHGGSAQTDQQADPETAHAFEARQQSWLRGRTILLIDDVMTTGATVDECARVLQKAGTVGVYVATVARG